MSDASGTGSPQNRRTPEGSPAASIRGRRLISALRFHGERAARGSFRIGRDFLKARYRSHLAGISALAELSRSGPMIWIGLAVVTLSLVVTAYLSLRRQDFPSLEVELWEGQAIAVPPLALYVSLLVMSLGWPYLLVSAACYGLGTFVLATAYACYFGLFIGLELGGTLWFVVVPVWLLAVGGWVASSRPGRWRLPLLFILSYLVSLFTYGAWGLKALLPTTWGHPILALVYFALVANPLALRKRKLNPTAIFVLSVAMFSLFHAVSLVRIPAEQVLQNTFLAFNDLLGLVSLFWLWVGLDLANGAIGWAERIVSFFKTAVPRNVAGAVVFPLWGVWILAAFVLGHGFPMPVVQSLVRFDWGRDFLSAYYGRPPSIQLATTLRYDFYLTLGIMLLAVVLRILRGPSPERLIRFFYLSLLGFFALWGTFSLFFVFSSEELSQALSFWPLLVFIGGMLVEILKILPGVVTGGRPRSWLFLGLLILLGGISLLELSAEYPFFRMELILNSFLGLVYVGVPYLLYVFIHRRRSAMPLAGKHLLILFGLGMLSAIPSLVWKTMVFAPLLWLAILLGSAWSDWTWERWGDGVVYALAVAMGFSIFYTHPLQFPIPAVTRGLGDFLKLQNSYAANPIWPWEARWWFILLGASGSGALLGYLLSRARKAQGRARLLWLAGGALASMAFLTAWWLAFVS